MASFFSTQSLLAEWKRWCTVAMWSPTSRPMGPQPAATRCTISLPVFAALQMICFTQHRPPGPYACCHLPPLTQALIAEFQYRVSCCTLLSAISVNRSSASCHVLSTEATQTKFPPGILLAPLHGALVAIVDESNGEDSMANEARGLCTNARPNGSTQRLAPRLAS